MCHAQVLFLTIMSQLYAPLNSFSSNYRQVSVCR
jgi:ABC-type transport system involved in Fe-S cluster assembly fused permease/ATPase subunit